MAALTRLGPGGYPVAAIAPTGGAVIDLAGGLASSLAFNADLTVVSGVPANYVDFSGNLGGVSLYGVGKYGVGKYSRVPAFEPVFVAVALDIVGTDELAGDLRPIVSFAGSLAITRNFAGDITPSISFGGDLTFDLLLDGNLAPQIVLEASLTFDLPLTGDLPVRVDFQASELISGPLWEPSDICPLPPWTATEPCPPPEWVATNPCPPPEWVASEPPSSLWTPTPDTTVDWEETELCNG